MSREELRSRAGAADERGLRILLLVAGRGRDASRPSATRCDWPRTRSVCRRSSSAIVDRLEEDFLRAEAAPPSPEEAHGPGRRAGGDEEHELFQVLVQAGKLVRVKESLFFHARALDDDPGRSSSALLRERKEIGPADIKDLLGHLPEVRDPASGVLRSAGASPRASGERRILRAG